MALKHVGRLTTNKRKVVVAYRTLPGDATNCLVVTTENLMGDEHDSLMKLLESNAGQTAHEFAEAMARSFLPDGRNMLASFHATGKLAKVSTSIVEMTPDTQSSIILHELNKTIAQQKGVSIEDLAISDGAKKQESVPDAKVEEAIVEPVQTASDGILSDEQLAAQLRSQADAMFKEAKRLREQAETLVPTKKKKIETESA